MIHLLSFGFHFLLFFTSLCLSFLDELKKSISNISLVVGKYVTLFIINHINNIDNISSACKSMIN